MGKARNENTPKQRTSVVLGRKTEEQIQQLITWDAEDRLAGDSPLTVEPSRSEVIRAAVNLLWHHEYGRRKPAAQRRKENATRGKNKTKAADQ